MAIDEKRLLERRIMTSFSGKFREIFETSGMEIDDFCKVLGINERTMWRYMAGESLPRLGLIYKIMEEFGESADWLIEYREK